jgi:hypothetical protein
VSETTKKGGDGEIPREVSDRIIADVRSLIESKAKGFENNTRAGKTLGVSQPSVTAWLAGRARVSYKVARVAEEKLGKDYLGDPQDTPETRAWGMKWKALSLLVRDGFDPRESYVAVDQQRHDHTHVNVSWGDYYEGAKSDLAASAPQVQEADIPRPAGPSGQKLPPPNPASGGARRTIPPEIKATSAGKVRKPSQKGVRVRARKTDK